ncbi:NAD(P)/FAD-dependent oxidoreductase [Gordonia sp. DT30]|uniref:NAD(P)/FAD-dependent oxidoreductase n=1 Tax=unclassified Gordonia (in: high G+C Gram-positive bacteria) TaxID=2657482 RepID=UPI003CFA9D02
MNVQRQTVVIVGGGYAGTMAANRLSADESLGVVMINARDHFVERIRLHQWACDTGAARRDYSTVLAPGVRRLVDTVDRIDAPARRVHLDSGRSLSYDWLIYAVGSTGGTRIDGADAHAYSIAEWESATRLRDRLARSRESMVVTVIGGGLTGVETAAELAGRGHRVALITDGEITPSISERGRTHTRRTLHRLGVTVHEHTCARRIGATSLALVSSDGEQRELPTDLTVVATGFGVPDLAVRSGLACDSTGRLRTDAALVSADDRRIVGAGDAVAPVGMVLRMSCQSATPLGVQAARTVCALAAGEAPVATMPRFVGQCISLGRRSATVQLTHADDSPTRAFIGGPVAAMVKETVCRATIWGLRLEARHPGVYPDAALQPSPAVAVVAAPGQARR